MSAFVGVFIQKKITRKSLLFWSTTLGILTTGALVVFQGDLFALIFGILLGTSFGISFPASAALFGDHTEIGNRGRIAGILVLMTFILISIEMLLTEIFSLGIVWVVALIMILRSTSYLALTQNLKDNEKRNEAKSYTAILTDRNFVLYIAPWVLFNLVSGLANFIYPGLPKTLDYENALEIGNLLQFLSLAAVSLVSGYLSDRFGRKPPVVIGVVAFGVSFAILGFATSPLSLIIQLTIHGIAWGFCMVAYFAIPGDLADFQPKEKFYATSTVLPFISYMATGTLPAILGVSADPNFLSPILSIFLFVSVVPVLFARDTLSEQKITERKMVEYAKKVAKESKNGYIQ